MANVSQAVKPAVERLTKSPSFIRGVERLAGGALKHWKPITGVVVAGSIGFGRIGKIIDKTAGSVENIVEATADGGLASGVKVAVAGKEAKDKSATKMLVDEVIGAESAENLQHGFKTTVGNAGDAIMNGVEHVRQFVGNQGIEGAGGGSMGVEAPYQDPRYAQFGSEMSSVNPFSSFKSMLGSVLGNGNYNIMNTASMAFAAYLMFGGGGMMSKMISLLLGSMAYKSMKSPSRPVQWSQPNAYGYSPVLSQAMYPAPGYGTQSFQQGGYQDQEPQESIIRRSR